MKDKQECAALNDAVHQCREEVIDILWPKDLEEWTLLVNSED